jgi:hypothetical protein
VKTGRITVMRGFKVAKKETAPKGESGAAKTRQE